MHHRGYKFDVTVIRVW